jgi:hypothetical protein
MAPELEIVVANDQVQRLSEFVQQIPAGGHPQVPARAHDLNESALGLVFAPVVNDEDLAWHN